MALDPQVKIILEEAAALGLPPYNELSPAEARKKMIDLSPPVDPRLKAVKVENREIPGPAGKIPIRLYYPAKNSPLPVLIFFHGGGWVIGNLDTHDAICHALAKTSGCIVAAIEYRLAPEHQYPAAVEDAYAATVWISENAAAINADAKRIAVGGESAGGTLATVIALIARDRGGPQICLQILVYPVTNYAFNTQSYISNAEGFMVTREMMKWFWDQYLESREVADHPYVSPLRAADLCNLPPALVITAAYDPLCDEGEAYAAKLQQAGVEVKYIRYEGMIHGFFRMTSRLDKAKEALDEVAKALKELLK